jgi:hypothetical protein
MTESLLSSMRAAAIPPHLVNMSSPDLCTYFIQEGRGGAIKIGKARGLQKRLRHLQTGNSSELHLLLVLEGDYERDAHLIWWEHRIRGEWFSSHEIERWIRDVLHIVPCSSGDPCCREVEERAPEAAGGL